MTNSFLNPQYFWPPHPRQPARHVLLGDRALLQELVAVFHLRQGARRDPQRDLSSWLLQMWIPPPPSPESSGEQCPLQGSGTEISLHTPCSEPAPQLGMKPCRLHLCSRREITLIWSKIHVFIHYSPLFPCSRDAGDTHPPKLRPVPAGQAAPMPC